MGYKPDIGLLIDDRDVNLFISLFRQTAMNWVTLSFAASPAGTTSSCWRCARYRNRPAADIWIQSLSMRALTSRSR
jgi:hypothetical protein